MTQTQPRVSPSPVSRLLWHGTLRRSRQIVDFEVPVVTFTKVCLLAARVNTFVPSWTNRGLVRVYGRFPRLGSAPRGGDGGGVTVG